MTPRPSLARARAALLALAAGLTVGAVLLGAPPARTHLVLFAAQLAGVLVLVLAGRREAAVWRWWAGALAVIALGPAALATVDLAAGALPGFSVVVATPLVYAALVRWNRFRTYVSDPGDWLNGLSAVVALAAAVLVAQRWFGFLPAAWPSWQEQLWALVVSSLVILLGTAATVAGVGGLSRDVRMWLVLLVLAGLITLNLSLRGGPSDGPHTQLGWTVATLGIALASVLPRRAVPVPATSQAPAVGALLVLLLAAAALGLDGHRDGWTASCYAAAAVVGISLRMVHLVRELKHLADSRQQALTDELTGTGNRRALLRELDLLVADGRAGALLLLDVDRFKEVNDRDGHHAGDDLLRRVVAAARHALPPDAVLTRIGGDEFAVLLPGRDECQAARIGQAVHAAVVERAEIGVSVGVRSGPAGALDADRLLRQADTAMYSAKTAGGGVSVYDSEVDARLRERAGLADEVRRLVRSGHERMGREVVLHYQPQVDLTSGRVVGVEALVRWQHPTRGLLPPLVFLPLVEELGLMQLLTGHVLRRAAAEAATWSHDGVPLRISVNVSASCLGHPDLLPLVDEVLTGSGLAPGRLVLEVTETTLMADPDLALAVTHALTHRGVQLSIDDYGTGYSSLAYLTDLPATELKLDRAFTVRVLGEPRTAEIVEATVALAHRLGLRVVAEGVEDEETRAVLHGLDVDESQGYLHARPLPPADLVRWLTTVPCPGRPGRPALVVGSESRDR
ncbi:putative bifunctional diguanylate cyclase/phosphodiesterase [Kineococcus sp. TBRC 1896]|uniref:Bifunctional diguanylate cyclase/phosphodiesterase n=1 Tax=Kineococcus mangrovi TaxID=1660183 RepID=A0ABV4I448_9ACTN